MIRRSFRIGLTLGLLGGLAFALVKMFGARPDGDTDQLPTTTDPWPPLSEVPTRPTAPAVALVPDPAPPAPAPAPAHVPDPTQPSVVATPPIERAPAPQAAPKKPAAKKAAKAATKKATATKKAATKRSTAKTAAKKAAPKKTAIKKAAPKKAAAKKTAAKKKAPKASWVVPQGDVCPTTHPVKAKLASKIFHLPGMLNYTRTKPDRCYLDATAAEADDLRPAKR